MTTKLDAGIHNIPEELYRHATSPDGQALIHQSELKEWGGDKPANAIRYELENPPPLTPATVQNFFRGTFCHVAVLEPERLTAEFERCANVVDGVEVPTHKGKKEWKDAAAAIEARGKTPVKREDWAAAFGIRDQILSTQTGKVLFDSEGMNEFTMVWQDLRTGAWCTGRPDRWVVVDDGDFIIDLKTTDIKLGASPSKVEKAIEDRGLHMQAAFYMDGLEQAAGPNRNGRPREYILAFAEWSPPYNVAFYQLEEDAILRGRRLYEHSLDRMLKAEENNDFPGYPDGLQVVGLPRWAKDPVALLGDDE